MKERCDAEQAAAIAEWERAHAAPAKAEGGYGVKRCGHLGCDEPGVWLCGDGVRRCASHRAEVQECMSDLGNYTEAEHRRAMDRLAADLGEGERIRCLLIGPHAAQRACLACGQRADMSIGLGDWCATHIPAQHRKRAAAYLDGWSDALAHWSERVSGGAA